MMDMHTPMCSAGQGGRGCHEHRPDALAAPALFGKLGWLAPTHLAAAERQCQAPEGDF